MSRFPKGFVDQEPPKRAPERHIRVFADPMSEAPQICVFIMDNFRDVFRGVSLNIEHAEQMGGLMLELAAKARAEQAAEIKPDEAKL